MSRRSPYRIELAPEERAELERRARRQTATKREVFRAQIVVLAAGGLRNDEIAESSPPGPSTRCSSRSSSSSPAAPSAMKP
jgi:hypothetical protein